MTKNFFDGILNLFSVTKNSWFGVWMQGFAFDKIRLSPIKFLCHKIKKNIYLFICRDSGFHIGLKVTYICWNNTCHTIK
jgi:hypothetical protein